MDFASSGGMQVAEGSIAECSTSSNNPVTVGFRPKVIRYNTKGASGTYKQYFVEAVYFEDFKFENESNEYDVAYLLASTNLTQSSYTYGNVGQTGVIVDSHGGILMEVTNDGFVVGPLDNTGYGKSLNWIAYG